MDQIAEILAQMQRLAGRIRATADEEIAPDLHKAADLLDFAVEAIEWQREEFKECAYDPPEYPRIRVKDYDAQLAAKLKGE